MLLARHVVGEELRHALLKLETKVSARPLWLFFARPRPQESSHDAVHATPGPTVGVMMKTWGRGGEGGETETRRLEGLEEAVNKARVAQVGQSAPLLGSLPVPDRAAFGWSTTTLRRGTSRILPRVCHF